MRGGILLSVLLLLSLFSFIFLLVLEDYQLAARFSQRTTDYYQAHTMAVLTKNKLETLRLQKINIPEKGNYSFNVGVVSYSIKNEQLTLTVKIRASITYKIEKEFEKVSESDSKSESEERKNK